MSRRLFLIENNNKWIPDASWYDYSEYGYILFNGNAYSYWSWNNGFAPQNIITGGPGDVSFEFRDTYEYELIIPFVNKQAKFKGFNLDMESPDENDTFSSAYIAIKSSLGLITYNLTKTKLKLGGYEFKYTLNNTEFTNVSNIYIGMQCGSTPAMMSISSTGFQIFFA